MCLRRKAHGAWFIAQKTDTLNKNKKHDGIFKENVYICNI